MLDTYHYLKIYFNSAEEADEALPKLKEFFLEGGKAYEYWLSWTTETGEIFWNTFEEKFPLVTEYLNRFDRDEVLKDALPCFGLNEEEIQKAVQRMDISWKTIRYSVRIWHGADWDYFVKGFIKKKFGAIKVKWISSERVDPFRLI